MLTLRSLEKRIERFSVARNLSIWWTNRQASAWRRRNPGRPFGAFYVEQVRNNLERRRPHPTLGRTDFTSRLGARIKWDRGNFSTRGLVAWREYRQAGVQPGMRCIEFGCGSLRVGQHAMRFLERGNYWGIDVTDRFMEEGRGLIDPGLIEDRRPRFSVICDQLIDLLAVWQPQFIFSHNVLQHVRRAELPTYFERLSRMMGPGSKAVLEFVSAPRARRIKAMSWAYPDELLRAAAAAIDPEYSISFAPLQWDDRPAKRGPRRLMILERP